MRARLLAVVVLSGCGAARSVEGDRRCESWQDEVGDVVRRECASCHSGPAPAGGYDLTSYFGVFGGGSDGAPNAVAGERSSLFLTALADERHARVARSAPTLERWLVSCDAAYNRPVIHTRGIMNPGDEEFHGALIRRQGYDFAPCAGCHGEDFRGGKAEKSCFGCHANGPTACATCHEKTARSGGHPRHAALDCGECHRKPLVHTEQGHLDPPPVEVIFGEAARRTPPGSRRAGDPAWDGSACANVYCHGGAWPDASANGQTPRWDGPATGKCDTCHGEPPATHASARCPDCHRPENARHLDGMITVGDGAGSCTGCHGANGDPAPQDLHQAHLRANGLRGPVACGDCHVVPKEIKSAGHIDSDRPAEVFPPGSGGPAFTDGARPTFDATSRRCADVYCHGGGRKLAGDASAVDRTPAWSGGAVLCGLACHGTPPDDGKHPPVTVRGCVNCHPATVDVAGAIVFTGGATKHMNGVVDGR